MNKSIRIQQDGRDTLVLAEQVIPRPIDEVFSFFSDARNLERLTPELIGFRILTSMPIEMSVGTIIDYKMRIHGIPIRWRTRIVEWNPPHCFADEQLKGPYHLWHHTHTFMLCEEGTRVGDRVVYRPISGALMNTLFVKRDVKNIFEYRQRMLDRWFMGDRIR